LAESLLLSAIAAGWQFRLADGARVHPVVSRTLVPSELPVTVPAAGNGRLPGKSSVIPPCSRGEAAAAYRSRHDSYSSR
jgi:hypothetical protein